MHCRAFEFIFYFISVSRAHTRYCWTKPIPQKNEDVVSKLSAFENDVLLEMPNNVYIVISLDARQTHTHNGEFVKMFH